MVNLHRDLGRVNGIYEPEDGSYLVHNSWSIDRSPAGEKKRMAVVLDNPPAFFADKEIDDLEIDGYNLRELFRWCITMIPN